MIADAARAPAFAPLNPIARLTSVVFGLVAHGALSAIASRAAPNNVAGPPS